MEKEGDMSTKSEEEMKSCFVKVKRRKFTEAQIAEMKADSIGEISKSESSSSEDSMSSDSGVGKRKSLKDGKNVSCKECKQQFNTHKKLINHVDRTHKAFPFKCVICKSTFKMRQPYANHMKTEHPEMELFPCDYPNCGESFHTKKKLSDHKNKHFQYVCRFCKRRFIKQHDMLQHVSEVH